MMKMNNINYSNLRVGIDSGNHNISEEVGIVFELVVEIVFEVEFELENNFLFYCLGDASDVGAIFSLLAEDMNAVCALIIRELQRYFAFLY